MPADFLSTSFLMEPDRTNTESLPDYQDSLTELHGYGDRELWYAEGRDGSWKFPLWVQWRENAQTGQHYAFIVVALCPYYKQGLILKALFELHDIIDKPNKWLIRKEMVEALLKKAPGITPQNYYLWSGEEAKPMEFTRMTMPEVKQPDWLRTKFGRDSMLVKMVADECGLQTSVVKIVLDGLSRAAVELMIGRRTPVDLGFCKLVAVPFRANWKEIVCYKLRKLGLLKALGEESAEAIKELKIPETLCSAQNIAVRRGTFRDSRRIDFTIEAVPSKEFEKAVSKRECKRSALGRTSYVASYEKAVEGLYDEILDILRSYLKKVHLPFARISESRNTGGLRFIETVGVRARAHGVNLRNLPVHIIPPVHGFSALAEESDRRLVYIPAAEVPEVPVLSQGAENLRQPEERRGVEELGDGENRDGGVSLLDASESLALWEPVFSGPEVGTGEASGVDGKRN